MAARVERVFETAPSHPGGIRAILKVYNHGSQKNQIPDTDILTMPVFLLGRNF
jgi:hypothetical protein